MRSNHRRMSLTRDGTGLADAERIRTLLITFGTLQALNVPLCWPLPLKETTQRAAPEVVLLSYGYWQNGLMAPECPRPQYYGGFKRLPILSVAAYGSARRCCTRLEVARIPDLHPTRFTGEQDKVDRVVAITSAASYSAPRTSRPITVILRPRTFGAPSTDSASSRNSEDHSGAPSVCRLP